MKILGKRISEKRKELGISQIDFSKKINISNATLSQYESGDINISTQKLMEISKILDVTPNYLLGIDEQKGGNFSMDKYSLLEKCINTSRSTRVNVEKGADKSNIIIPILKNSLDDIIILDVNGETFKETEKYRQVVLKNKIEKIDLFRNMSESFNPFYYLNYENSNWLIEEITNLYLGTKNTYKDNFLTVVIVYLFFVKKFEDKNSQISFPMIYDFIKKLGTEKDIVEDFIKLNDRKSEEEINSRYQYKIFSYKDFFKEFKIMDEKEINKEENIKIINKGLIPKYYHLNNKLIKLGTGKLLDLKNELLKDLEIFSNDTIRINTVKNSIEMPIIENINSEFSTTTYFIVDEDKINELAPLIRLYFYLVATTRTLKNLLDFKLKDKRKKSNKLIVLIDIFDKLGKQYFIEKSSSYIFGYYTNYIIFSNIENLKKIYGEKNCFLSDFNILKLSKNKMEYLYIVSTSNSLQNDIYKETISFNTEKKVTLQEEIDDMDNCKLI